MNLIASIVALVLFSVWRDIFTITLMFGTRISVIGSMLIMAYPVFIFAVFAWFNWDFFFIPGRVALPISVAVMAGVFYYVGLFDMLKNRDIYALGYTVKSEAVYFNGEPVPDANPKTFRMAEGEAKAKFGMDDQRIYFEGRPVEGSDPKQFRIYPGQTHNLYWTDGRRVYFLDRVLDQVSPDQFEAFDNSLAKGGSNFYVRGEKLDVDPSFRWFRVGDVVTPYGKDQKRIYYENRPILPEADVASFEMLEDPEQSFGRDAKHVYHMLAEISAIVPGADLTFKRIPNSQYYLDRQRVYFRNRLVVPKIVEGADPATFEVLTVKYGWSPDAQDKTYKYREGQRKGSR